MNRRQFLAVSALPFSLAGCGGRSESYRYKLTLAVDTPEGVRTGSSVVSNHATQAPPFWGGGAGHRLTGEALYLDLGPGRRPLIALLTHQGLPGIARTSRFWSLDGGPVHMPVLLLYGETADIGYLDAAALFASGDRKRFRGPRAITPADLPDLVTFADVDDPKSVLAVDPENLEATLGEGVKWNAITIEMTDEPVTTGIEKKLGWLSAYYDKTLEGSRTRHSNELSNMLGTGSFHQSRNVIGKN